MVRCLSLALLAAGAAGCSSPPAGERGPRPEPPLQLFARLESPVDIALEWRGTAPDAAGQIVEFATAPQGQFTILQFLSPDQARYRHSDLIPETPFYYRVRPFYGPASLPVEVRMPEPPPGEDLEKDDGEWAAPRRLPARAGVAPRPIRAASIPADAAPTDLQAEVVHSAGVRLTWTDRASDEEGYLIEVRPAGQPQFQVAAVVDPDVNSFGLVTLPAERRAAIRVRAFYYGRPSNLARQTTGPAPSRSETSAGIGGRGWGAPLAPAAARRLTG